MPLHNRLGAYRVAFLIIPLAHLIGCGGPRLGMPDERELAAARDGQAAVVLMRAVAKTSKGSERTVFGPKSEAGGKAISIARLTPDATLQPAGRLRSLSAAALRNGWVYLVLKPGTYYLLLHDTTPNGLLPTAANEGEDWLLEVPPAAPVVYAGTVVFGRPRPALLQAPFRPDHPPHVTSYDTHTRDDSSEARELASTHLPALAPASTTAMRTMVARRYGRTDPVTPDGPVLPLPIHPVVRVDGITPPPTGYRIRQACGEDGAWDGLYYGDPILKGAGSSTNSAADVLLMAAKIGLMGWALGGGLIGQVVGIGEERHLQPCVTQAVQWTADYDASRRLAESLSQRLDAAPGASRPADPPVLRLTVQQMRLQPCRKAHLACVEARVRVRVWDPRANRHLADRVMLYSNEAARHRTRPYGEPTPPHVLPVDQAAVINLRALRRLPAPERRARIEAELDRAVAALSDRITTDLSPALVSAPASANSETVPPRVRQ